MAATSTGVRIGWLARSLVLVLVVASVAYVVASLVSELVA
jgi:hypothetical protein